MNAIVSKLLTRANDLADVEPIIALFLGAALLAIFFTALSRKDPAADDSQRSSLIWTLYRHLIRLGSAILLVALVCSAIGVLRSYLRQTVNGFQRDHGRITQANYNAVETIWGAEQVQPELNVDVFHMEEITERTEFDDPKKPAQIRKKTVHVSATGNPFISANHVVSLRQNPRKKGSAFYGGYETDCSFTWRLRNPSDTNENCRLTFPLPSSGAMYDGLVATLNGKDVLPQMQLKNGELILDRPVDPAEEMEFHVAFKSRGLSYWYFQVREAREIRDFTLTLNLPDMPKTKLNYPGGCMTPTKVETTPDNLGTVLTYHFDHALTDKGMGIALPQLPQPGATTRVVLDRVDDAWHFTFAVLALSLTLIRTRHAVLMTLLFSVATAFGYGLLADFSDLLLGFWGTAIFVLLPFFLLLSRLLARAVPQAGKWLAAQFFLFAVIYPCLAGLDADREGLYLDLCALVFLAFITSLMVKHVFHEKAPDAAVPATA